ncbi:MAG TPA: hypothetical protein VNR60_05715 [Croceibacterium sp.]|nr:hypothetical protein [Croceibacterium sp.]
MNSLLLLLSPLTLLLPPLLSGDRPRAALDEDVARQVRIEERVIIRIAPSSPSTSQRAFSQIPRQQQDEGRTTFREQKIGDCIPVSAIAAVQPGERNRLLLFMRDRSIFSAALERTCSSDDFYSGFYVERQPDGQLCSGRDHLQSRSGANCRVAQFNRLVVVRD